MKQLHLLSVALFSINIGAQNVDKLAVQKTIAAFLKGVHSKDSLAMKKTIFNEVFSIGKTR